MSAITLQPPLIIPERSYQGAGATNQGIPREPSDKVLAGFSLETYPYLMAKQSTKSLIIDTSTVVS